MGPSVSLIDYQNPDWIQTYHGLHIENPMKHRKILYTHKYTLYDVRNRYVKVYTTVLLYVRGRRLTESLILVIYLVDS